MILSKKLCFNRDCPPGLWALQNLPLRTSWASTPSISLAFLSFTNHLQACGRLTLKLDKCIFVFRSLHCFFSTWNTDPTFYTQNFTWPCTCHWFTHNSNGNTSESTSLATLEQLASYPTFFSLLALTRSWNYLCICLHVCCPSASLNRDPWVKGVCLSWWQLYL